MKTIRFIFILILFQSVLIYAQEPMVAYRKEGIWHYYDTNGKLMWQPFLDVASFPNGWQNGLLKAAAMNVKMDNKANVDFQRKQVLYDKKGRIVFQPKFEGQYRIITGFDKAGYLEIRDFDAEQLILCDKQGNVVYKSSHGYCQYLGDGVVAYIKNGEDTKGDKPHILLDIKTKKILNEINCLGFLGNYETGAVFSFNDKAYNGMFDRTGKELLSQAWESNLLDDTDNILISGFVALQDTTNKKFQLFNKKGEIILKNIDAVETLKSEYLHCRVTISGETKEQQYFLNNGKAVLVEPQIYGHVHGVTEGGILVCLKNDGNIILLDKNLRTVGIIPDVRDLENVKILKTHIWVLSDKETIYNCFNEKGQKTGTIKAETIGDAAYSHIPFMRDGKWGLAHVNGKEIIKPILEFNDSEIPPVQNGFWEINNKLPDGTHRFDYYNFQGKLAMSTTSEKDGWDYILPQETVAYFFKMY